jgi:hypothetical protein
MIKNIKLKVSADPRGKIKSGMKNEKGLPQSLDYFNISKFPELLSAYGLKPSVLILFFPTNNIADFFDCNYILYGKDTKLRSCDGDRCIHRIDEEVGGEKYLAGQESECSCAKHKLPEKDKKRCHYNAYFKAYVAIPQTGKVDSPMCYLFETGSHNSGENVLSELEKIRVLNNGTLIGIPFALSVKMVSGKETAKTKFPIWTLTPIGMLSEIRKRTDAFTLEPVKQGSSLLLLPHDETSNVVDVNKRVLQEMKACLSDLLKQVDQAKSRADLKEVHNKATLRHGSAGINDSMLAELKDALNAKWLKVKS